MEGEMGQERRLQRGGERRASGIGVDVGVDESQRPVSRSLALGLKRAKVNESLTFGRSH